MDLTAVCATLLVASALLLFLLYLRRPHQNHQPKPKVGGCNPSSALELIKNGHRILDWTTDLVEASPTGTVATAMGVITADPAAVEHVLKTRFDVYEKGPGTTDLLRDFLGDGIFNSDGDHWKLQRRTASLEFSTATIRTFVMANVHLELDRRLLPFLSSAAATAAAFDLQEVLERFSFDNVCKVVFDEDLARLATADEHGAVVVGREFNEAFEEASNLCVERFKTFPPFLWKLKRLLGVGSERRLKQRIAYVHRFAMEVVKRRRSSPGDDLLSKFIADSSDYTDEFLRDIITSFVLAGRDTTSAVLTWFFWLISGRPAVRDRILEEIRRVRDRSSPGGRRTKVFTLDEVKEMNYLHAALSETLRLYPPVPLQGRTCTAEADVLPGGTEVKKGTNVMYNSYAMGRSRRLWGEDSREFRPERWLEEGGGGFRAKSPYLFPAFHAGPRMCLGKDMAYIQMKVIAATVLERFEVEVEEAEREREPELILIMKMKGKLMVRIKERK